MDYILIEFDDGVRAYQEVDAGSIVRICDEKGNTLVRDGGSRVIDEAPPHLDWFKAAPPEVTWTPPAPRLMTKLEFLTRFTDAEYAGVLEAAKQVPLIAVWLEKFHLAEQIDLEDQRLRDGIFGLEGAGLIAAGRASEVLA